jgi:pimeloyl-ACP methyl ester carboxylesterase
MPSPQGVGRGSESDGQLARLLVRLGHRVITFDAPGSYASTRPPRLGLDEMVSCAAEALSAAAVSEPLAVVGQSQATLCVLALALRHPAAVRRVVLVGPVDGGWRSTRRDSGMPWCWKWTDLKWWRFAILSLPLGLGVKSRGAIRRFRSFFVSQSLVDRSFLQTLTNRDDLPAPARLRWQTSVRNVDLGDRLGEIACPVLVCAGRFDPQTPLGGAHRIAGSLPAGTLVIFDRSGHYPHVEQPEEFMAAISEFLVADDLPR